MDIEKNIIKILLLGIFVWSCQKKIVEDIPVVADPGTEEVLHIKMFYSDSANVLLQVTADTLLRTAGLKNEEIFKGNFRADFFDSQKNTIAHITSDRATRKPHSFEMIFLGNVVFKNSKGETLQTEELHYSEKDNKAYSDHFCKITNQDEVVYGFDFEATDDFNNYKIKKMTGRVKLENPQ